MLIRRKFIYDGEPLRWRLFELGIVSRKHMLGFSDLSIPEKHRNEFHVYHGTRGERGHLSFRGLRMEESPRSMRASPGAIAEIPIGDRLYAYYRIEKSEPAPVEEWLKEKWPSRMSS